MNIQVPNENQEMFYDYLQKEMARREYEDYCILGAINAISDRHLDINLGERKKTTRRNMLLKPFLQLAEEFNMVDA